MRRPISSSRSARRTARAAEAIAQARPGTLVDPHLGATIVVEARSLSEDGCLLLSGPGIESSARLSVGMEGGWVAARAAKNVEFPLGVDLIFVDHASGSRPCRGRPSLGRRPRMGYIAVTGGDRPSRHPSSASNT